MEPLRLESDTRYLGAIFVVMGLAIFFVSSFDPEIPHWFGPIFAVMGTLLASAKLTSIFDFEAAEIRQSRLRYFFLKSEVVVGFDSVVRAGTGVSSVKGARSVGLLLDDGSTLDLGSFNSEMARAHVLAISEALELDKRVGAETGLVSPASSPEWSRWCFEQTQKMVEPR